MPLSLGLQGSLLTHSRLHKSTRFVFLYHPQASRRSLSNFNILQPFSGSFKFPDH
jgi:hypothetical protein